MAGPSIDNKFNVIKDYYVYERGGFVFMTKGLDRDGIGNIIASVELPKSRDGFSGLSGSGNIGGSFSGKTYPAYLRYGEPNSPDQILVYMFPEEGRFEVYRGSYYGDYFCDENKKAPRLDGAFLLELTSGLITDQGT